ncbi:MAG: hypothetical protein P8183_07115 [Anaerolineae bacterium]
MVEPQWRGRVLHLPSGETAAFQDWEHLIAVMQMLGPDNYELTLSKDES